MRRREQFIYEVRRYIFGEWRRTSHIVCDHDLARNPPRVKPTKSSGTIEASVRWVAVRGSFFTVSEPRTCGLPYRPNSVCHSLYRAHDPS